MKISNTMAAETDQEAANRSDQIAPEPVQRNARSKRGHDEAANRKIDHKQKNRLKLPGTNDCL
jgi:hypothetical protein